MFLCAGNNSITTFLYRNLKCGSWFSTLAIWVKSCLWSGKGGFIDSGTSPFPGDPGTRGGWMADCTFGSVLTCWWHNWADVQELQLPCRQKYFSPFGCLSVFTQPVRLFTSSFCNSDYLLSENISADYMQASPLKGQTSTPRTISYPDPGRITLFKSNLKRRTFQ